MKLELKDRTKLVFVPTIFGVIAIALGIASGDYVIGTFILMSGLLNAWYASLSKSYNFFFGTIFCLLSSYVAYINGLYGIFFLSLFIYAPLQVLGWISWREKEDDNHEVKIKRFTFKNSIIITGSCIIGSVLLGLLLSQIPGQQLAFLDASSNAINICGILLMHLRFRECWWILLFNNTIDLSIWIINVISGNPNSIMMLLTSISYLAINLYGLIMWHKNSKHRVIHLK